MSKSYEDAAKVYAEFIGCLKEIQKEDPSFAYRIEWTLQSSTTTEAQREELSAEMSKC